MNWDLIITAAVGIISGGAIAGFYLRKQTRGAATAGVVKESMEALRSALETLTSQQDVFASTIKSKDDEIALLRDQIKELKFRVSENERKVAGMQKLIDDEFRERKLAEHNICFVDECKLREPPLGTYKKET